MTENEAIKFIGQAVIQSGKVLEELQSIKSEAERIGKIGEYYANLDNCVKEIEACRVAMNALTEIQQYRAIIGLTIDDLKALEKDEVQTIGDALKIFSEWHKYRAIGTVEEFRALKEKNEPIKPYRVIISDAYDIVCYGCPCCDSPVSKDEKYVCFNCGQKLDWSEE